jgi:branched-chain amino acid transport system substrate-binding protein
MGNPTARTDAPWRVGLLFSKTGITSVIEQTQLQASILAIEEINAAGGVNGRELQAIHYDPGSSAAGFAQHAKRLMTEDGVTTIFGCYTSSSRKAVLPVVERLNGLLWYPTLYEGFEYSPNIIYTGAAPNQNSVALSQYLLNEFGNRFFLIGSDYIYPRETNRVIGELVRAACGSVVGERYVSLRAQRREFLPLMRECLQRRPSVIFSTVVGESTTHLYQAYADAGFDPRTMPIASLTTTEAEIGAMGAGVGCGHITAAPYFEAIDSEVNRAFVRRYKHRFGSDQTTNMCVEAAYFQVHIFARALALTNSLETDCLRPMVLGSAFDAPQGQIVINPHCGHTDLWTRLGRVNEQGKFDIFWQSRVPVGADPYLVGHGAHHA